MDDINNKVSYVISFFLLISTTYIFGVYTDINLFQCLIISLIDITILYNELFLLNDRKDKRLLGSVFIIILAVFHSTLSGNGYIYYVYSFLGISQVVRNLGGITSIILSSLSYVLAIISVSSITENPTELWKSIIVITVIFIISLIIIYLMGYIIIQNNKLKEIKDEILEKSLKESYAFEQLQKAYDELENYTVLKERNNIAREMHDTVGHNLTVALVELETFRLDNESIDDKNKLGDITERVRKSLSDLRTTVHKLQDNINWEKEIDNLIENIKTKKIASITYNREDLKCEKSRVIKCIYRIIQESITNGIKHGGATAFIITIKVIDDKIVVRVIDNGSGNIAFTKGFGLNSMSERVKELGGVLEIHSDINEGFTITAYISRGAKND